MMRANLEFTGPEGRTGQIELDGEKVHGATGVHVNVKGGVELVLTLRLGQLAADLGAANVTVDQQTHETLAALGWTPPEQQRADLGSRHANIQKQSLRRLVHQINDPGRDLDLGDAAIHRVYMATVTHTPRGRVIVAEMIKRGMLAPHGVAPFNETQPEVTG